MIERAARRNAHLGVLALGVLVLVLSFASWAADTTPAEALDPSVHRVEVLGQWSTDGEFGRYRIVKMEVMGEHVVTRVEIQWLADEPASVGGRVIRSVPLDEVGLPMLSDITWTIRNARRNRLAMRISGILPDGKRGAWNVIASMPGSVKVGIRIR
jgi:hypothetical protein